MASLRPPARGRGRPGLAGGVDERPRPANAACFVTLVLLVHGGEAVGAPQLVASPRVLRIRLESGESSEMWREPRFDGTGRRSVVSYGMLRGGALQ